MKNSPWVFFSSEFSNSRVEKECWVRLFLGGTFTKTLIFFFVCLTLSFDVKDKKTIIEIIRAISQFISYEFNIMIKIITMILITKQIFLEINSILVNLMLGREGWR